MFVLDGDGQEVKAQLEQRASTLASKLRSLDDIYSNAADKPVNIAKNKLYTLVDENLQSMPHLFRHLAKTEAQRKAGDVFELLTQLEDFVRSWRTASA